MRKKNKNEQQHDTNSQTTYGTNYVCIEHDDEHHKYIYGDYGLVQ